MTSNLGLKLIAVIDLNKLRLFEAQGIKINKKIEELPLSIHKEHRHEKGNYQRGSNPGSAYEAHTPGRELEYQETAKIISQHLEKVMVSPEYKELMIAADSKTIGHLRQTLSPHVKKTVTKEVIKDLAHHDMAAIEEIFFS